MSALVVPIFIRLSYAGSSVYRRRPHGQIWVVSHTARILDRIVTTGKSIVMKSGHRLQYPFACYFVALIWVA